MLATSERLEANSIPEPNSGCLLWLGAVNSDGYGILYIGGRAHMAHRVAWAEANGPIPSRLCVCHKCDVPGCVNPDHLWLGTHRANMDDRTRKGRGHRALGRAHGRAVLNDDQVLAIRADRRPQPTIAAEYRITRANVSAIQRGLTWKHLRSAA